jgi:hypothetical protein
MKNNILNKKTGLPAILLLLAISFSFLHCELGILTVKSDNHETHDYCQLVNAVNPPNINTTKVLPLAPVVCDYYFIPAISDILLSAKFENIYYLIYQSPPQKEKLFIQNNILLI